MMSDLRVRCPNCRYTFAVNVSVPATDHFTCPECMTWFRVVTTTDESEV